MVICVSEVDIAPGSVDSPCEIPSLAFQSRDHSACELNKKGDNMQPSWTPFSIWNQAVVPCPVLTVAS